MEIEISYFEISIFEKPVFGIVDPEHHLSNSNSSDMARKSGSNWKIDLQFNLPKLFEDVIVKGVLLLGGSSWNLASTYQFNLP